MRHDAGVLNGDHDARSQTEAPACRAAAAKTCPCTASAAGAVAASHPPAHTGRFHQRRRCGGRSAQVSLLVGPAGPDYRVDYRYLYEIVADRSKREEDRGKVLDAKITALLAGAVAFIGFTLRLQFTSWSAVTGLLYVIPLGFLLAAFMAKPARVAPTVESLVTFFPQYPDTTLRDAVLAMERSCRANDRINDIKLRRLDLATVLTATITAAALVTQFAVALR
ncbi:MAG: hypothetical protein JWM87_2922 [Candidatus Eremiobacteraeota bacterium]|nr:hypothetical protein [Candidatus Eremiobacteraeota bacterium]